MTVVEKIKTQIWCSISFFPPVNFAVYEAIWKSIVETDRPQMTTWRMRTACYVTKSTNTHQYYV